MRLTYCGKNCTYTPHFGLLGLFIQETGGFANSNLLMNSSVSARMNAALLEEMYTKWCADAHSVDDGWAAFFEGFQLGVAQTEEEGGGAVGAVAAVTPGVGAAAGNVGDFAFFGKVMSLIYNYRLLGHAQARFNPLKDQVETIPALLPEKFGFSASDLEREISNPFIFGGQTFRLRELIAKLQETYSGFIGLEYMHIGDVQIRQWVREKFEARKSVQDQSSELKIKALDWIQEAEIFENFLGKKFIGEKRFSLEGGEGAMVVLNGILSSCPKFGVEEIEMGMPHRGRLTTLATFVRKSIPTILYEFTPNYVPDLVAGDGDVKYHLGYESIREFPDGKVRVSLAANPSHLEAVNAVVEGKARARQRRIGDDGVTTNRTRVLPLLMHGDAAFAGQGSVAELLNFSQLPGYRTGGTIHLIVNNQIGFTTSPYDSRSSPYATDVAKMIESPILHVNGEEPTELFWAAQFALEFRQKFGRDVVIDMYCYRRQGHNETDQAAFTQPLIAKKIESLTPLGKQYKARLVAEQVLSQEQADAMEQAIWDRFEAGYQKMVQATEANDRTAFSGSTAEEQGAYSHAPVATGISREKFDHVGNALTAVPENFQLNPTLAKRFVPRRAEAIRTGTNLDWALGEALAFGSLLMEGKPVRLSGQDCRRGTFSHRHAVLYDYETRDRWIPLDHLSDTQAKFRVYNSLLSEFAVLGFDYGYSLGYPEMLTMWEAQFGDFANGAQVIIDQFICSAESKWQTPSDLVMLLPHGYEGQGPEHSSARLERFLQLCAEDNMIVANLSTPAQYFHALRRQKLREIRKPLVLMTPKSLLTRAEAVSSVADFLDGTCFQEALPDDLVQDASKIERVIFCSGKVYYDLAAWRKEHGYHNTAILRIEQLYPFHAELVQALLAPYANAKTFIWAQEEPENMGAASYIRPILSEMLDRRVSYAGRERSASPAAGAKALHYKEFKAFLNQAFTI